MASAAIPVYLKFPVHEQPDRNELRRLNEIALSAGWRNAIEEVYRSNPVERRYVTDPAHHNFIDLLPLRSEDVILELGPGLGQNTAALAERAGFVHGVEIDHDRAHFAAVRCRQEGLDNVAIVCGGDDCRLPYYHGAMFDGVVVNLVLEWCGQRDPSATSLEMQQRLLDECVRVLKPGGWFYLTTKNRFGVRYLLGRRDEHTYGWPFGQALPRGLLELILRLRGKTGPKGRGLIHSYNAMRRLLTQAGLTNLQPYWAVPEFRFPREYVPVDSASIRAARRRPGFFQSGDPRTTKLLMPLVPAPLVKHVMLGLVFLAEKPA